MKIEQFVMAYGVEQDRIRALLPDGFSSLRPVLRINAEIRDGKTGYVEFNTAAEKNGVRGWLNIAFWNDVPFEQDGKTTRFITDFLDISFTGVGIEGGCPAEKDNAGCFFPSSRGGTAPARTGRGEERILWLYVPVALCPGGAHGVSLGKTLSAYPSPQQTVYPRAPFTAQNAAQISCQQVLGSYVVRFER